MLLVSLLVLISLLMLLVLLGLVLGLGAAAAILGVMFAMNRLGVKSLALYLVALASIAVGAVTLNVYRRRRRGA